MNAKLENTSRAQRTHAAAPTEKPAFRSQIYLLLSSVCPWADSVISRSLAFLSGKREWWYPPWNKWLTGREATTVTAGAPSCWLSARPLCLCFAGCSLLAPSYSSWALVPWEHDAAAQSCQLKAWLCTHLLCGFGLVRACLWA